MFYIQYSKTTFIYSETPLSHTLSGLYKMFERGYLYSNSFRTTGNTYYRGDSCIEGSLLKRGFTVLYYLLQTTFSLVYNHY